MRRLTQLALNTLVAVSAKRAQRAVGVYVVAYNHQDVVQWCLRCRGFACDASLAHAVNSNETVRVTNKAVRVVRLQELPVAALQALRANVVRVQARRAERAGTVDANLARLAFNARFGQTAVRVEREARLTDVALVRISNEVCVVRTRKARHLLRIWDQVPANQQRGVAHLTRRSRDRDCVERTPVAATEVHVRLFSRQALLADHAIW